MRLDRRRTNPMLVKTRSRASRRRPSVEFRPSFAIALLQLRGRRGRCRLRNWLGRRRRCAGKNEWFWARCHFGRERAFVFEARGVSYARARRGRGYYMTSGRACGLAGRQGHRFAQRASLAQGELWTQRVTSPFFWRAVCLGVELCSVRSSCCVPSVVCALSGACLSALGDAMSPLIF